MRIKPWGAILTALALILGGAAAQAKVRAGDMTALALDRILSPAVQPLTVTSPAAPQEGQTPIVYTAFGNDISPPVEWDGAPPNARSFVVIMEDADGHGLQPPLHWLVYNIPGSAKGLGRNLRNRDEPKGLTGMMQGRNYAGGVGYVGPNPPDGDPPHHYHIQVFALGRVLKIKPGLSVDKVIAAMNENVLADGEAVGAFEAPVAKAATP